MTLGYVFEAFDNDRECKVALKWTTKAGEYVSWEYEILEMLKDVKNCVKVLDIFYTKSDDGKMAQNLVFEHCSTNLEALI